MASLVKGESFKIELFLCSLKGFVQLKDLIVMDYHTISVYISKILFNFMPNAQLFSTYIHTMVT